MAQDKAFRKSNVQRSNRISSPSKRDWVSRQRAQRKTRRVWCHWSQKNKSIPWRRERSSVTNAPKMLWQRLLLVLCTHFLHFSFSDRNHWAVARHKATYMETTFPSLLHGDYISQSLLQLGVTMRLSSSQWGVRKRSLCNLLYLALQYWVCTPPFSFPGFP